MFNFHLKTCSEGIYALNGCHV